MMNYKDVFQNSRIAIIIRNSKGNIIEANSAASELMGYSLNELTGMNMANILSQDSLRLSFEKHQLLLKNRSQTRSSNLLELIKKTGEKRYVESMVSVMSGNQSGNYIAIVRDITTEIQQNENIRLYITEITNAQEEERKRISHELHDDTIQSLTAIMVDIELLKKSGVQSSEKIEVELKDLQLKISKTIKNVRAFCHYLRPDILDRLGYLPAVEVLLNDLKAKMNVEISLNSTGQTRRLPPDVEVGLFRITQEALRNIYKHSDAEKVEMQINFNRKDLKISIKDNGKGFKMPLEFSYFTNKGKLGLIGMKERAVLLGADLSIKSKDKKSTEVIVKIKG